VDMRASFFTQAATGFLFATSSNAASLRDRTAPCAPLPAGAGPKPSPDTAAAFLAFQAYSNAATQASTPNGYVQQFSNLKAATIET
jgi:hypothetical protein